MTSPSSSSTRCPISSASRGSRCSRPTRGGGSVPGSSSIRSPTRRSPAPGQTQFPSRSRTTVRAPSRRPGNMLLEIEEPIVREILDGLPPGVALDAACGQGRHATYLSELGHTVIGVDSRRECSSRRAQSCRRAVPRGAARGAAARRGFGRPRRLRDRAGHVPALEPVFTQFARVIGRGGHLVVSDLGGIVATSLCRSSASSAQEVGYTPVYG